MIKLWLRLSLNAFKFQTKYLIFGTIGGWLLGSLIKWLSGLCVTYDSIIGSFIGAFGVCLYFEYKRYKGQKDID